jgi:hypothetical protein
MEIISRAQRRLGGVALESGGAGIGRSNMWRRERRVRVGRERGTKRGKE